MSNFVRDGLVIYTRYRFDLASVDNVAAVLLRTDYDDGYACWLNGIETARSANLAGRELTWNASLGGLDNHGSTESPKGTPNPNRAYQEEIDVDFVIIPAAAVDAKGKLAASWANLKQSR